MDGRGSPSARREFRRSVEALPELFTFIEGFFAEEAIDVLYLAPVELAVEELFTNLVKYDACGPRDILLEIGREGGRLSVSLTNFDVERFDITKVPEVPVDLPLEERRPGGLGIHLIKKMMDGIEYEYGERQSRTTLIKNLE